MSAFKDAIFLDVGTHIGQTLEEVTKYPKYQFRTVYAFEPMPKQFAIASGIYRRDPRVQVFDYGLGDHTGATNFHGSNDILEASIWNDMYKVDPDFITVCPVIEASLFFQRHITEDDVVIMKLNCEGSEIAILNNLIDTGEIWKIHNVMIDFDIRKVNGKAHLELELLERLLSINFNQYCLCDTVMVGHTHQDRIANWLRTIA